jgi:hypothetical protein
MRCKICTKTFRSPPPRMRESQICTECQSKYDIENEDIEVHKTQNIENISEEDIDISKGQARILKIIAQLIPTDKELCDSTLLKALHNNPDMIHFIKENWGDVDHFTNLALYSTKSNQISQILNFLNLKNKIGRVPTKQDMKELSKIDLSAYEEEFTAWENFLDLLGFDPWYRNNNLDIKTKIHRIRKKQNKTNLDNNEYPSIFSKDDTINETVKKINQLRIKIKEKYKQKDLEENYADYSYVEMFELLEKYIEIMPNKSKYHNIRDLL